VGSVLFLFSPKFPLPLSEIVRIMNKNVRGRKGKGGKNYHGFLVSGVCIRRKAAVIPSVTEQGGEREIKNKGKKGRG